MCCNDYIINLVISEEGSGLAELGSDKEAESSPYYSCSGTKD